jgi:hypothetical protein
LTSWAKYNGAQVRVRLMQRQFQQFSPLLRALWACVSVIVLASCTANQAPAAASTTSDATSDAATDSAPDASTDPGPKPAQTLASKSKEHTVQVFGALKTGIGDDPALTVRILDAKAASPVTGLALTVDYTHTAMGHGGSKIPQASETGDGRYQLAGLVATMAGSWRVTVGFASDSAAFDVEVE